MTLKRMKYGLEYLDWFYNKGGWKTTIFGLDSVAGVQPLGEKLAKAVGPWDAPTSPYSYYFEPKFSASVYVYAESASEILKLLPKTTFLSEGDSFKYLETHLSGLQGVGGASTPFTSGSAESAPTVATLEEFKPAYLVDPWETSLMSRTESTWQLSPKLDPSWIKEYHAKNLPNLLDTQLAQTVDTVSNDGSTYLNLESIDRIISTYAESGAGTTYCAATDGDIYWGKSSVLIDKSADTDETFGPGAGSGVSLPASANARVLDLGMIDDVVAASVPYSERRRYIGITGPKTLNEMQKLIDPKQRYLDNPMDVEFTINGVSTRKGVNAGFTVASYVSNGIQIPIFTTRHAANETSSNRSGTVTDADIGNIYIVDLDTVELRTAIPISYMETPPEAMLTGDVMKTRHWLLYAAQLICTNFRANAAVKYLKST